jgi:Cu(I)/Ag(I) efflux system periplasmic protein CusF
MKSSAAAFVIGLILATPMPLLAAQHDHGGHAMDQGQTKETAWAEGTVKKINAGAGKVTISHGPLPNLEMPAMTMVFRVKDRAWLDRMRPGDRIRFVAERHDGALTVTDFHPGR